MKYYLIIKLLLFDTVHISPMPYDSVHQCTMDGWEIISSYKGPSTITAQCVQGMEL